MARLSMFLPPFAGDYSGAASTLFGLDCLVVIVDAGCCTRNYVEYDEPRWARRRKTAFSASLRTLEAVMGDDSRIVDQTVEAARELGSSCIAILGTPVPAVCGMDLAGIAREVESLSGVPTIGIPTCGFETYEQGVSRALLEMVQKWPARGGNPCLSDGSCREQGSAPGAPASPASDAAGAIGLAAAPSFPRRPRVAVWGLSPHDFLGQPDVDAVLAWLEGAGLDVVCAPGGNPWSLDALAQARTADASLVVAWSGLAAARQLRAEGGVPYLVGRPWCAVDAQAVAARIREGLPATGDPCLWEGGDAPACGEAPAATSAGSFSPACAAAPAASPRVQPSPAAPACGEVLASAPNDPALTPAPSPGAAPLLLVGEQVAMASLRPHLARALAQAARPRPVTVASFFATDPALAAPGDVSLPDEAALVSWARANPGFAWVGDPLLAHIPALGAAPRVELPHEALSSTLFAAQAADLAGPDVLARLTEGLLGLV